MLFLDLLTEWQSCFLLLTISLVHTWKCTRSFYHFLFFFLEKIQLGYCFFRDHTLQFGFQLILLFWVCFFFSQWSWVQNFIELWVLVLRVLRDAEEINSYFIWRSCSSPNRFILFFPFTKCLLVDSHSSEQSLAVLSSFPTELLPGKCFFILKA